MGTRSSLRTSIRAELNDSGASQTWSDSLLNEWIAEGIRDYGRKLPRERTQGLTTVADQADYTLASDCLEVKRVEHPEGFFRIRDPLSGGDTVDPFAVSQGLPRAVSEQLSYEVWGQYSLQVLTLRPKPTATGEPINLQYWATWPEPAADGDEISLPDVDEHLLILYAAWRALRWIDLDEAKRQRFERDRGVTARTVAERYRVEYEREIAQREKRTRPRRLMVRQ